MRLIWWKITRPDFVRGPVEVAGDALNIHLPEEWSAVDLARIEHGHLDNEWLTRLQKWVDGSAPRD